MKLASAIPTLTLLVAAPMAASAQDQSFIRLQEIEGRTWLIGPDGRPFFAHGVTHIGTAPHGEDVTAIQPRYNPGFPRKDFDRVHKLSGKPIIICDFAIRFKDGEKKIRGWKPEESPKIAGERYAEYVREAMATPYIIGTFWCNPIDSKSGFKKTGIKQGLFDRGLTPRPELNRAIRELNQFLDQKTPKT